MVVGSPSSVDVRRIEFLDFVETIRALVQRLLHLCLVDQYFSVSDNFQSP